MNATPLLTPAIFLSDLEPPNAVSLTRADPAAAVWLPHAPGVLDWLASGPRLHFGPLRRFIHRAAAGPVSKQLYEWAGLEDRTRHIYFSEDEDCLATAQKLSREGALIACQHYTPRWRDFDINWSTPPLVLSVLNNKANLADFVPKNLAPSRRMVERPSLLKAVEKERTPFALKVGTPLSSGGGCAAAVCTTPEQAHALAQSFLAVDDNEAVFVIEAFYPFVKTWCANVGIYESGRRYFGAAQQILDEARKQTGSFNGGPFAAPAAVRDACLEIAEAAFHAGYRGVAGMDMGITDDGRLIVFDLNFRQNACTAQILYHENACARAGTSVSRGGAFTFARPLAEIARQIEDVVKAGIFVPLASFDKALHETAGAGCTIAGIALGVDTGAANAVAEKIAALQ